MTFEKDHALDRPPRGRGLPLLRQVVAPVAETRRRSELQELFDLVLPGKPAPEDELWMGHGPARPMSIPDLELLCALEADGFDGLVWSELENRLAGYGVGVIGAWVGTGEIYRRATEKGRPVRPPRPPFSRDEQIELAYETVGAGIRLFQEQGLQDDGWRPDRGARLSTYFLGSCVLCFANACRKQLSARRRAEHDVFVAEFDWHEASVPSAERVALARMDVEAALTGKLGKAAKPGVPPDVARVVLNYLVLGYDATTIVELINSETATYTLKAVRGIRTAYRAYIKEQRREGGRHA
ncbi:hypothetical protein [Amycolatopsis vancoresmycina]|uniref:Uncharacterized protein n=1 Tax=Amycolatopsis vancoresmycina DSM 44592 TaxID=1292037 RepID=R1IJJ2_9PSEU|nr:hypothetical protein [Amycolatopsis vancoresmycina]EOD70529.1 hypothetical protein H480_00490 [Amycolatopsis vancoresmycina DSM 44592]